MMANTDFTARCMAGKALDDVAGKQDVIADLDTIRAGAAAGATAVQPATLENYQPKIDSTHKLDADLVDDTNSTNKFATQSELDQIELNKNNILLLEQQSKWHYTETRFTNTGTSDYENTGISFTAPANQSIEFYAYDRKDGAYLDKILVCDSLTTLGNTTIVSANSIIDGFTDAQYWALQTTGIVPTFNTDVTYYIWVKRKSTGSNLVGLAWRYLSQ